MKTISEILRGCSIGDVLTDGSFYWKVTNLDYDGAVVAIPLNIPKGKKPFELWSDAEGDIACIPNLHRVSSPVFASEMKTIYASYKEPKSFGRVLKHIRAMAELGFNNTSIFFNKKPIRMMSALRKLGYDVDFEHHHNGFLLYVAW